MGSIIFQRNLNNIEGTQGEPIARYNNFCVLYSIILYCTTSFSKAWTQVTVIQPFIKKKKKKKISDVIMLIGLNLCSNISLPSIKFGNRTFPKLPFFFKNFILLILIFQGFVIYGELAISLHSNLCNPSLLPA